MEAKPNKERKITIEEFARLRKRVFHNGIAGFIVLAITFVLLIVMMGSSVDSENVYRFRTFTFIIGLMYIGIMGISSQKVLKLQKEHPEWLTETSVFHNKITEPKEWRIRRLGVMVSVLVIVLIAFITWYKPESKNMYDGNANQNVQSIIQNASDPTNNVDYQKALGAIEELKIEMRQITYQCIIGDPLETVLLIISSDGSAQKYTITLSDIQSFDYFRDEFPSEEEYALEEFTVTDEEWEALVSVIEDNEFTSLPETLPIGEEVYDGASYAIQIETSDATYLVRGEDSSNSDDEEHQRFNAIRDAIKDLL